MGRGGVLGTTYHPEGDTVNVVPDAVAALAILSLIFFAVYLIGLWRTPVGFRAKTPTFDRYGNPLPPSENPGFQETESERHHVE